MLKFLKAKYNSYRIKKAQRIEDKKKAKIAKAFNDRYTYVNEYITNQPRLPGNSMLGPIFNPRSGYAWMCPQCNLIHHPYESSLFSGLQYPACCDTPQGHRLGRGIKTR